MYGSGTDGRGARILAVRLGAMGDILHALPAVASLKHSFPGSELTWVVEPRWAPLLEGNPFVDRVLYLRRGSAAGLRQSWRELRERRYDLALDFQGLLKSALVAASARAERIFGFHRSQLRERWAALFYSSTVESRSEHVVDRNLDLASAAGATSMVRSFPLPPGEPEGDLPEGDFVLASPLAGWRSKQWPLEHYAYVAKELRRRGTPLVLNGAPAARAELSQVGEAIVHLSGLGGLIHATRRAAAVIGVDSGPMHLAAALGKPGVAIFGPTSPERNGPYGGSLTVLRSGRAETSYKRLPEIDPSMREVTPSAVLEAVTSAMEGSQR